jgi:hypothetical protein
MSYTRIMRYAVKFRFLPEISWYLREKWCLRSESNQRHEDFQSSALPTELQRQMATRKGLEPSTSGVTGRRSNQLNYRAKCFGGNNRARTCDIMLVRHALYQLSYAPLQTAVVVATKVIILNHRPVVNTKFVKFVFSYLYNFNT